MVPSSMWVANNCDVGLIKNAEPFIKPKLSQYPLTSEAAEGNQPVFLIFVESRCHSSMFHEWCFVEDLQAVNAAVHALAPLVPNPYTILA